MIPTTGFTVSGIRYEIIQTHNTTPNFRYTVKLYVHHVEGDSFIISWDHRGRYTHDSFDLGYNYCGFTKEDVSDAKSMARVHSKPQPRRKLFSSLR